MAKISRSPNRYQWQRQNYSLRRAEEGRTAENDWEVKEMLDLFDNMQRDEISKEADPYWSENNLEYDLRSTDWILSKARATESYAQNIYAALCNNSFIKLDVLPILRQEEWSCSWRHAGGIVSHMRESGDYIDWYCSGIQGSHDMGGGASDIPKGYVPEGCITEEIRNDFKKLGWTIAPGGDWEKFE